MRISNAVGYALTVAVALTMLAVRSGGASPAAPTSLVHPRAASQSVQQPAFQTNQANSFLTMHRGIVPDHGMTGPSFMDPRALGKPLVFVSYGGTIDIYQQGGKNKLVGQITGPDGVDLATDTAGNLYSANETYSTNSVTVYAPPYTNGPKLTLPGDPGFFGIAVSRRGTVAVAGCTTFGSNCHTEVLFYAAGSTTPCATVPISQQALSGLDSAAFDRNGNLYVVSGTNTHPHIGKIDGGCNAKKATTLATTNTIQYAGSIRIDKAGRIAVLTVAGTSSYTFAIDTYDPPKQGSLGSPVSTTPLPSNAAFNFAFRDSGRGLWVGVGSLSPSNLPGASEYAYPAGGAAQKTIVGPPAPGTGGVAVTPALIP
jgi:hypothetical protein